MDEEDTHRITYTLVGLDGPGPIPHPCDHVKCVALLPAHITASLRLELCFLPSAMTVIPL